jgi:type I restriction enzyme S subunit
VRPRCLRSSGPPVLRIPNVEKASIDLGDLKRAIDPSAVAGDDPLKTGDFLVVRTNGSRALIGRGALVREAIRNPHHFASYLIRFRLSEKAFSAGWLSILWQSPRVRAELEGKAATSAGQYNLSLSSLLPTQVPVPPLAEQQRLVAEVDRRLSVVDELEATVEKNLARCARLRQSILKMAFEGRLVPQDPNDEPANLLLERIRRERDLAEVAGGPPRRRKAAKR